MEKNLLDEKIELYWKLSFLIFNKFYGDFCLEQD